MFSTSRNDERGAINTITAIVAIALVAIAVGMGASYYRSSSSVSANTIIHQRERIDIATFKEQLRRDADTAQAIYFPTASSPLGEAGCTAAGPCDQVRFAAQRPDKTWSYWGYYADTTNDKIYRCGYASSEASTCTATVALDGAVTFQVVNVAASAIATAQFPGTSVSDVTYDLGTGDPRVLSGNHVLVVQFANSTSAGEVHLAANPQAARIALSHGTYNANARTVLALNTADSTNQFTFLRRDNPLNGVVSEDRYNGSFSVGKPGGPYNAPSGTYNCVDPILGPGKPIAYVTFGAFSSAPAQALQQPNSGTTMSLPFTVTPNGSINSSATGSCTIDFHSVTSNANDTADATIVLNLSNGVAASPVVLNPNPVNVPTNSGSVSILIRENGYNGAFAISASTCAGIATPSIVGNQLVLSSTATAGQTCQVTVTGQSGGTPAVEQITITGPVLNPGTPSASGPTTSTLNLTTTAPTSGTGAGYKVSYYTWPANSPVAGCQALAISATCTVSGLSPGTTYGFYAYYQDSGTGASSSSPFNGTTTAAPVSYSISVSPSTNLSVLTGYTASWTSSSNGSDASTNPVGVDRASNGACTYTPTGYQAAGTTFAATTVYSASASTCAVNMVDQHGSSMPMTISLIGHSIAATGGTTNSGTVVSYTVAENRTDGAPANMTVSVGSPCSLNGAATFSAAMSPVTQTANVPSNTTCIVTVSDDIGSPNATAQLTSTYVAVFPTASPTAPPTAPPTATPTDLVCSTDSRIGSTDASGAIYTSNGSACLYHYQTNSPTVVCGGALRDTHYNRTIAIGTVYPSPGYNIAVYTSACDPSANTYSASGGGANWPTPPGWATTWATDRASCNAGTCFPAENDLSVLASYLNSHGYTQGP